MEIKLFRRIAIILLSLQFSYFSADAQNWDIDIAEYINPDDPKSSYWKITSGSVYFFSTAIPISLLVKGIAENNAGLKRNAAEMAFAIGIEVIITESIKFGVDRLRPAEKYPMLIFPYKNISGKSFPSGHTSLSFATAASLSIQFKKWYITLPAYLWATSVGYSRIYLGVHYPSDVIAGAAIGIGSAYLSHWLNQRIHQRKHELKSHNNNNTKKRINCKL